MKKTIYLGTILVMTFILLNLNYADKHLTVQAQQVVVEATSTPSFEDALSYPQKAYLGTLEYCESRGDTESTILDSNNKYSYGLLQFQIATFVSYGIKYGILPATTTIESALPIVHDPVLQERIATRMLADGLKGNWYNCTLKLDPYPTLSPRKDLQE